MIHIDLRQPAPEGGLLAALVPRELWAGLRSDLRRTGMLALALAALGAAGHAERRLDRRAARLAGEERRAHAAADSLRGALQRAETLQRERAGLARHVAAIARLEPDPYGFVRLMDQVAASIPENSWVESLAMEAYNAETGAVEFRLRGYSPSVRDVAAFQRRLAQGGIVREVRLAGSGGVAAGGVPVIRFELSGRAGGGDGAPGPGYAGREPPSTPRAEVQP